MRMSLVQIRKIIILASLLILSGGIGYRLGEKKPIDISEKERKINYRVDRSVPSDKENLDLSLFWDVWDRLERSYLKKEAVDPKKMIYGAISGMVSSLGDPYTVFLPPSDQKQAKEDLAGSFDGVGIQLGYKDSRMVVIAPLKGTPAESAGVLAGDFILRIKDESKGVDKETQGMSLPEAVTLIRGPGGTQVTLSLLRKGEDQPIEVKLSRETIMVKSVEVSFIDKIAHLKLSRFGERTNEEWEQAITEIENKRIKGEVRGVVLDLRNNPGGFLQGAIFIASEFLSDGVVVKQEQSQNGGLQTFSVNRKGKLLKIPLVVLVNQGSASASEIVAGTLQERKRARLVGEKTFGKGTIQEAEELVGGSGLHVTIARWLLPSGKTIDKEGVKPDFEIKMDEKDQTKDPPLEKAVELLK